MMRFAGKAALVTGGGGGIGGAICQRFADEGAAVGVLDRRGDAAQEVAARIEAAGGRALALTAEITEPESVAAALATMTEALGAPDVLVNNAAWALKGDLESTALADWRAEIEIDLDGQFVCAKAVLPGMIARGRGAIVNIGSVNGLMALGNPAYSAAKAGLLSFTRSLAVEYGPKGIRANMVSPGTVETDIETWRIRREKNPQIFDRLARWYPVGRVGRPAGHRRRRGLRRGRRGGLRQRRQPGGRRRPHRRAPADDRGADPRIEVSATARSPSPPR